MRFLITLFGIFLVNLSIAQTKTAKPSGEVISTEKKVPSPFTGPHQVGCLGPGPKDTTTSERAASPRKMIHGYDANSMKSSEDCWVELTLRVNPSGEVVSCQVNGTKSTATDREVIRQVRKLILEQVKYAPREGSGNEVIQLRVHVTQTM